MHKYRVLPGSLFRGRACSRNKSLKPFVTNPGHKIYLFKGKMQSEASLGKQCLLYSISGTAQNR